MLHVFNHSLDQRSTGWNLPATAWQSLQAQRSKLAAASLPEGLNQSTQQMIGLAIAESFVHAFRIIMAIGATLAGASALIALIFIGTARQREYSRPPKAFAG
jgi:hypothetical protein